MAADLDFAFVLEYRWVILHGLWVTLVLTSCSLVTGFLFSILVVFGRTSGYRLLRAVCAIYVEVVRNTPMLVQLFFFYFGLAALGVRMSAELGAFLIITMNVAAYSTEIVRAGLEATPKGHIDAGRSLAMSRLQIFCHVIFKPALQRIYPALTSQFILVMLGTSVASQIGAEELTSAANFIQSRNFRSFEAFVFVGLIYLILAIGFRAVFKTLGRRFVDNR